MRTFAALLAVGSLLHGCSTDVTPQYECLVADPSGGEPYSIDARRKAVVLETTYRDGFGRLDARQVWVGYGTGPEHFYEGDGYEGRVEAEDEEVLETFRVKFPAIGHYTEPPGGCFWSESGNGPTVSFDFVEKMPRYLRVMDLDGEVSCGDVAYVGKGAELLHLDLKPCLDRFCAESAFPDDPACSDR